MILLGIPHNLALSQNLVRTSLTVVDDTDLLLGTHLEFAILIGLKLCIFTSRSLIRGELLFAKSFKEILNLGILQKPRWPLVMFES